MSGRRMIGMMLAATVLAACSRNDGRMLSPPGPDQTLSIATTTTTAKAGAPGVKGSSGSSFDDTAGGSEASTATLLAPWIAGDPIPDVYTCKGANLAPSLVWRGLQAAAVEEAIVMTDVDANDFVQWLVVGIPPSLTNLDPAKIPKGAIVGRNSGGTNAYVGPCSPTGRHTYFITLYSLRAPSGVTGSTPAAEALTAINAVQIESVSVSGTAGA